jgi:hypothetical protein
VPQRVFEEIGLAEILSRSVYLEGYDVGRGIASEKAWPRKIKEASSSEEVGRLAGIALLAFTLNEKILIEHTFAKTESFHQGFFDGFTDYAEELRRRG